MNETIVRTRYRGLRDVHVAVVTANSESEYAAETPIKVGRAISAKISDKWSSEKIYSDDGTEDVITTYEGTEIELELNTLAPQDRALFFGQLYKNGFLVKNVNDLPPEIAIGYRTRRMNGKYEFAWHLCGKFGQGNEDEFETQADKIATKTSSLKGDFYERKLDGNYQHMVDESQLVEGDATHEKATAAIKSWFSAVQEPDTETHETGTEDAGEDEPTTE